MPSLPILHGRPGPGLLAHVLVSKYADHLITTAKLNGVYPVNGGVMLERLTEQNGSGGWVAG